MLLLLLALLHATACCNILCGSVAVAATGLRPQIARPGEDV